MELKDIASVAGKGGLFRIVKPTRNGVILESMDEKKARIIAHSNQRVSTLSEISIYTTDQEGAVELGVVLAKIHSEFNGDTGVDNTSNNAELRSFMNHILPEHDEEKVYPSDIKRLVSWYKILLTEAPELLSISEEKTESEKED